MGNIGFAVLNTDKLVFVKLGQHGPHVTTFAEALDRAEGESHLSVVEVVAGDPSLAGVECEDCGGQAVVVTDDDVPLCPDCAEGAA